MTNPPKDATGPTSQQASSTDPSALHEAIRTLTSNLSLDMVLQQVADLSKELVSATYSALGILGEDGSLVQFITAGISDAGRERIGDPPEGKGILGIVLREGQSLRLHDLTQQPDSGGFPATHPPMRSFLGVPIIFKGRV